MTVSLSRFWGRPAAERRRRFSIIGGFTEPDSGEVCFEGKKINDVPAYKRHINTVFQKYALFPHLNVYENIAFALRVAKVPNKEISKKVREMLELVALKGI